MLAAAAEVRQIGVLVSSSPHQMARTGTPEPGVDEWACTRCARRLLLRRPPAYDKVVLDPGDESAAHVGGAGGLRLAGVSASQVTGILLAGQDRSWLAEHGIDWDHPEHPGCL